MMHQKELFSNSQRNKFFNVDDYLKKSLNDQVFAKLLRERLLLIREKRNKNASKPYVSIPVGTLVLVRDNRPRVHKKLKPVYFKVPQKVVNEYKCTIYAEDILGVVRKHSKNNVKIMGHRSAELFSVLPDDIKLILGDEMDPSKFDEIKNTGMLPAYLKDLEIESELRQLRNDPIPEDTHLLEQPIPTVPTVADPKLLVQPDLDGDAYEEYFEDILSDDTVQKLAELHKGINLVDTDLTLEDVPHLYRTVTKNPPASGLLENVAIADAVDVDESGALVETLDDVIDELPTRPRTRRRSDSAAVDARNILPENTTRNRRVRFNLPRL